MTTGEPGIAVLVPVLRRPHRARPLVDSVHDATVVPHRIVFLATAGDDPMIDACHETGELVHVIPPNRVGDYAVKVNTGLRITDEPFLFTGADDLRFHRGWDLAALELMADPAIGVVGTQDLCNGRTLRGEHATHFLVRRRYAVELGTIDERGKIFHEGYPHEWVDDELVGTAKHRAAWAFADGSVVEHLHPAVGKAPTDALYDAQRARMRQGHSRFLRRRRLWR
jgi:glycosyltransferase involved in cell wall biosynthesis